jgi:hypothetical protein
MNIQADCAFVCAAPHLLRADDAYNGMGSIYWSLITGCLYEHDDSAGQREDAG